MTGIFLIAIAIGWLAVVIAVTRWTSQRFKSWFMKGVCVVVVFPLLLVAPLADELIGKQQFESLCGRYAVQVIDEPHALNRRVVYVPRGADQYAEGTAVRIRIDPWIYRDAETNQVLVSYHTLHAEGGWLIRSLGISESNSPLSFGSGCGPADEREFIKKLNIAIIN